MSTNIKKIFRFKLSDNVNDALGQFTNNHRFNERKEIKLGWEKWCNCNGGLIQDESRRLGNLGYSGDEDDLKKKMWTSVRYYHMKKENKTIDGVVDGSAVGGDEGVEENKQKRRKYITIDKSFLALIDKHINEHLNNTTFTPARAYTLFVDASKKDIQSVCESWVNKGLSKDDFDVKLKKTYKNRYFNIVN